MKLSVIEGNRQSLDGGAMFGNAPKAMWSKWVETDGENRIQLATRALYVEFDDGQKVLFETGVGAFFSPDMKQRFGVIETEHVLIDNLESIGVPHKDIDAVVLSHMHFDHAGGLLSAWQQDKEPELLFPNATYISSKPHWERTLEPHSRDKASFIKPITNALLNSGRLTLVDETQTHILDGKVRVHFSNGHTPGLMLSELQTEHGPMVYASDLIPGAPWVHVPITMGYDRFPELLINEKSDMLQDLLDRNGLLYFVHDATMACGRVLQNDRKRFYVESVHL